MAWNDLTLSDKARMMNLAVRSGINDLRDIQEVYNTYACGGRISRRFDGGGPFENLLNNIQNAEDPRDLINRNFQTRINQLRDTSSSFRGFEGGSFGGSGASSDWNASTSSEYDYVENIPFSDVVTFSEAYDRARKAGRQMFEFNGKLYNTDYDPNANLGPVQLGETTVGNIRNVYDEDNRIIRDSTRIEPYVGQIPGRVKRKKKSLQTDF